MSATADEKRERMDFNGKAALITGAGAIGGLGHATAWIFAPGGRT